MKLGFARMFVVEPMGKSRGLALMWKEEDQLEIQNYSRHHINATTKMPEGGVQWNLQGSMDTRTVRKGMSLGNY